MHLIDSHSHIFLDEFEQDRTETIARAKEAGVEMLILPNIDSSSLQQLKDTCRLFPDYCKPLIGVHPTSVRDNFSIELEMVETELKNNKDYYIGIGEIGIDLYWDKTFYKQQIEAFIFQLNLANRYSLPVVIHIRNSFDETFSALAQSGLSGFKGVFHCFSGTIEQAYKAIELGFKLGIGGTVTFKNAGIDKVVSQIGIEHIILETDSPYLAPVPHRGKRNEPSFLKEITTKIAEVKNMSVEEVGLLTSNNCTSLFNLGINLI